MGRPLVITVDTVRLEAIIAEALGFSAWGASKGCAEQLWGGKPPTLAGLDRAMGRIVEMAAEYQGRDEYRHTLIEECAAGAVVGLRPGIPLCSWLRAAQPRPYKGSRAAL